MIADGFTSSMPEYEAAEMYFGQSPSPQFLDVGRQDLTAIGTATLGTTHGTSYAVGDQFSITGVTGAIGQVTGVAAGVVTTFVIIQQGTGATVANNIATTALSGTGTGLTIDVTALGESYLEAVTACRIASPAWWGFFCCGTVDADITALAEFAQASAPSMCLFWNTSGTAVRYNASGNVAAALQTAEYTRAFGIFSTTQGGGAPNNAYIAAGALGVCCGLNTGLANSFFTMKFKQILGASPEFGNFSGSLSQQDANTLEGLNMNVYASYNNGAFEGLEQGTVANGEFLDQILNIDYLCSDIQYSVADLLFGQNSVPQTNAGQALLINAVNGACARAATRGFIAGGVWDGDTILNLTAGTGLPNGYLVQSPPYSSVSQADLAARQAAPIYCSIIEAGAVHFVNIAVLVQV